MGKRVDWVTVHRELAAVYAKHGMTKQADIHRRLSVSHEAARRQREAVKV